jgi:hypothetical protein
VDEEARIGMALQEKLQAAPIEEIRKDTVAVACPALAVEYKGQQKEDNLSVNSRRDLGG